MKDQLQTIRHAIEMATPHYQADTERFKNALTALDQIEAAVGAQEPVAWTIAGEITDWSKNFSMYKTQHYTRPVFAAPLAQQPQKLEDIEQYRMQMAAISTAAIGYWKEGVSIHPDYDTVALRDVAKLYAKYDELYKAQQPPHDHVAVTWDKDRTRILAVTLQDAEGRVLCVIDEAPAQQPQYEAGDMASAAAQGFRDGVASVAQQPQAVASQNPSDVRHNAVSVSGAGDKQPTTCKTCGRRMDDQSVTHGLNGCGPAQQPQAEAVPMQPASDSDMEVYRAIATGYRKDTAPQQADSDVVRDAEGQ